MVPCSSNTHKDKGWLTLEHSPSARESKTAPISWLPRIAHEIEPVQAAMPFAKMLPQPQSDFELLSRIDKDLWFATKRDDYRGGKYLAQGIDRFNDEDAQISEQGLALHDLMYSLNQAPVIAQIFNHENIVSIAGHIRVQPVVGAAASAEDGLLRRPMDYVVWDFCDAANLSALFVDNPYETPSYYLPESLCWHVLTSLTRAVTYLHDGKRLFFDPEAQPGEPSNWLPVDHDWNPILHRAIEPRNIFFQHPRGIETYGLCKLGNFEHAAVTNHIISPGEEPGLDEIDGSFGIALAPRRGWEPWHLTRGDLDKDAESFTADKRPYTLADEIWSIGSVVFTMMTGRQPIFYCAKYGCCHITTCNRGGCLQDAAAKQGCSCATGGCHHVPAWRCTHDVSRLEGRRHRECHDPVINIDSYLTQARYSRGLRRLVKDMLSCDPKNKVRIAKVLPFTKLAQEQYRAWREGTKEGMAYRDIDDDMMARWEAREEEMQLS